MTHGPSIPEQRGDELPRPIAEEDSSRELGKNATPLAKAEADQRLKLELEAQQRLSDSQREISMVREAHLKAHPEIGGLPKDFSYSDEEKTIWPTNRIIGGSRSVGTGEEELRVEKTRWNDADSWRYQGERGGYYNRDKERLSDNEAERLYKEMLDPSAVEAFRVMEENISEALARISEMEKDHALANQQEAQTHQQEVQEAFAKGVVKGERRGEVWSELAGRADTLEIELNAEDRDQIVDIIDAVAELKSNNGVDEGTTFLIGRKDRDKSGPQLSRQEELIFKLLGSDKRAGQPWVNGWWGYEEVTDVVYETIFPDLVLVKHNKSGEVSIERNTQRSKMQPKTTRSFRG